ncbi:transglutaminase family protein [Coraliomargarita parva]|uniref:transglutaminase family protein n=1 Tax=Coraliomargarita parva TaxID=3014050 RepID=UPI0022B48712|nr:transglutaminase family protein [Coraliomargarita parva]
MSKHVDITEFAEGLEARLHQAGIELTMGGEPTFVSALPDAPEWNTTAMGPEKLGYARRMAACLIDAVYPEALAMQVFGKWYPGEPLPRWNVVTLHTPAGELWPETERLLLDDVAGGNDEEHARILAHEIAKSLGLESGVLPAIEQDARGWDAVGWVLPLANEQGRWSSVSWPFSDDKPIDVFAGDSPIGLRLPLHELAEDCPRGALTVEVREGALEIFIPPLAWEAFRELIGMIRELVIRLDYADLVFCGYAPSETKGEVISLGLAADPGVLEVNLPPARTWHEYDFILRECAKAADKVELKLEKYQMNGAVYGTGGGSHLAFGGPDLARNPFLKDPRRITSILRYWQHHPALSYLFTGQYVGPGSQAPRVDEGPTHGLYELEVACEGIENMHDTPNGELIDQFLKNLMTDSSGNTHRSELCFDKFHNYAMPNGCLGILELRAFETYNTVDSMSAVALFVRSIFTRLFEAPFKEPLKRFGPHLHDRYFLPAFLWEDVLAICKDLKAHGFDFDPAWLEAVIEFRCPSVGQIKFEDGSIDVRRAFESWPLMAEESRGSSTVRVVDNSSDRLQVTLSDKGLLEKGMLLANGVRVPFEEVGGRMICGIRYKCASAYPALHPHVPIQSPLHLEWVDRKSGETLAASRYHYWNPGGPVYNGRPGDAEEARERRAERWLPADDLIGGRPTSHEPKLAPEYRYTLDLRRQLRV